MRNNRERWQFYNHPSKPALSASEARYWKAIMEKVLKVGIEFEFNLPEQRGTCRGDNIQCPCVHLDEGCWKGCTNTDACKQMPCMETCANVTAKCKPTKCAKCKDYKFKCIGITCVDFVSTCFTCDKFDKNCETCKKRYMPEKDPKNIRNMLTREFHPSKHYGKVSESGVVSVTTDGSLLGDKGVEIITVGRRVDYWEFFNMSKRIIDKVVNAGGYLNERTGTHMHVLASYYENDGSNEMEKDMPQIVLANFHQLARRYQNALTWMTIALGDPNHMTRWEKFRVSVLGVSPVTKGMRGVVEDVHRNAGGCKYGFLNYDRTRFGNSGDINRFHVEFRQADSTLCPSYYAALACLHYAFVIKAVEISRYGLLKVGDEGWLKKAKQMKDVIMNGTGNWDSSRVSNTSKLLDNRQYFIEESVDLVHQMKSILVKLGPAYDVLIKLAERPAAMRLIEGENWEAIEKDLAVEMTEDAQIDHKMREIVDLNLVEDCKSVEEWMSEVYRMLEEDLNSEIRISKDQIETYITTKMRDGEMIWSDSVGCVMAV